MPDTLFQRLARRLIDRVTRRPPDFVIGGHSDPYLLRWYLTPWRRLRDIPRERRTRWQRALIVITKCLPSVYLHAFCRSDDDRALHDHPWLFNCSILLTGEYTEHTIDRGGIHRRTVRKAGACKFRWGGAPHRVELHAGNCYTLFVTGPVVREWGFHCPERGWVHWRDFTAPDDAGAIGPGCGDQNA